VAKAYKVVFFFGVGKSGWTETQYFNSTSDLTTDALAAGRTLAKARLGLCGEEVTLEAIRVSELGNPNNSRLYPTIGNAGTSGNPAGNPWVGALCTVWATDPNSIVYHRSLILRGLPAVWQSYNAPQPLNPNVTAGYFSAVQKYLTALKTTVTTGFWGIKVTLRGVSTPRYKVAGVTLINPGEYFQITLDPNASLPTWTIGTKIHVRGARGPGSKGLNADAFIKSIPVTGTYLLTSRQKCVTGAVLLNTIPQAYARGNSIVPIDDGAYERLVNKKTGRPFFGTAGRRSSPSC
jgi:hypothetical protein